jgi:signal transduction histidine kinase
MINAYEFEIALVFFVYGLAFFSMGLMMALEAGRSPMLAEARALWLLAVFGFVHGIHEWLEMAIRIQGWFGLPAVPGIEWLRLALLVISFSFLMAFGLRVLNSQKEHQQQVYLGVGIGLIALFFLLSAATGLTLPDDSLHYQAHIDAIARYVLAVPGAALAALAMVRQMRPASGSGGREGINPGKRGLALGFSLAAAGFALYSLTQLFVPPLDFYPADTINSLAFLSAAGFPIQVVRAILAVAITLGLVRAVHFAEAERQRQFKTVQQARLDALEQVQQDILAREALRQELLRRIVVAQEDERARVARELHDETAQYLTALSLDLATLRTLLLENPNLHGLLDRLQSLCSQMSQGIYRLVHALRPAQLDDLGLPAALEYLADEIRRQSDIPVHLEVASPGNRLDPLIETALFRVAQEALSNAVRHAQCRRLVLRLAHTPGWAVLQVEDDGIGFDVGQTLTPPHGLGLAGMRERAHAVAGQLTIRSRIGQGTLVEFRAPISTLENLPLEEVSHEYHPLDAG